MGRSGVEDLGSHLVGFLKHDFALIEAKCFHGLLKSQPLAFTCFVDGRALPKEL